MKTLNDNYKRNVGILEENLKRGMSASQAYQVIDSWRSQFQKHNLYGEQEKRFINEALKKVESKTHIGIHEV